MRIIVSFGRALEAGLLLGLLLASSVSCSTDLYPDHYGECSVSLEELSQILSSLPLGRDQLREVHSAVSSSTGNGYDEEYTMSDLLSSPGAGVGEGPQTRAGESSWDRPMRDLIREYLEGRYETRSGEDFTPEEYLEALAGSDAQIYWPYSESWDGTSYPVITFDPQADTDSNVGYEMSEDGVLSEMVVTEETARLRPVWIVNRNDDSAFKT